MKNILLLAALCLCAACSPSTMGKGDSEEQNNAVSSGRGYETAEQTEHVRKARGWFRREYIPKHDTTVSNSLYRIAEEFGMDLDKSEFRRRMDDPKRAEVFLNKLVSTGEINEREARYLRIALYRGYETDIWGLSDF